MEGSMSTRKVILRGMVAVLTFTVGVSIYLTLDGGGLLETLGETAPTAIDQNCDVYAGTPGVNQADHIINGQGSRGPACTSGVEIRVRLRKDISWWPDKTLVDVRRYGTNF